MLDQVRARAAATSRSLFELRLIAAQAVEMLACDNEDMLAELWHAADIGELKHATTQLSADDLGRLLLDCALLTDWEADCWTLANEPEALFQVAQQYGIDIDAARREATAGASTPCGAARAPEGEGGEHAAGDNEDEAVDEATSNDAMAEESQSDNAGCAGNADQTDKAGNAGQAQGGVLWPFPKRAD